MTHQEIFEKVCRHLFAQGKPSLALRNDREGIFANQCVYRSLDGLKCAVGILIPDEIYKKNIEGGDADRAMSGGYLPSIPADALSLLLALQGAHDRFPGLVEWERDIGDGCAVDPCMWESTDTARRILSDIGKKYHVDSSFLSSLSFADR